MANVETTPEETDVDIDEEASVPERIIEIVQKSVRSLDATYRKALEEQEFLLKSQLLGVAHEAGLISNVRDMDVSFNVDQTVGAASRSNHAPTSWPNLPTARRLESSTGSRRATEDLEEASSELSLKDSSEQFGNLASAHGASSLLRTTTSMNVGAMSVRTSTRFQVLPEWQHGGETIGDFDEHQMRQLQYYASINVLLTRGTVETLDRVGTSRFVIHPASKPKIMWDIIAAMLLVYDVILVPMAPFDIPRDGFITTMGVVVTFYWSIDIIVNFFVGFDSKEGDCELRLSKIAWRYITTWFFPDMFIVTLDWLTYGIPFFIGGGGLSPVDNLGIVRVMKLARFVRLLRVLRVARLTQLTVYLHYIQDVIGFESTAILFALTKNLSFILLFNHIISCVWYWIGLQHEDTGWLSKFNTPVERWYDNYLRSMYWSISNFTPGSSGIQPSTTEELGFSVLVLFFALVCFSVFVSSTTTLINRLMGLQSSRTQQLWVLKSFLLQHKFEADLRERVLRYVNAALGARRDLIHRGDVHLLDLLSQPLREEVQLGLHLATLRAHPFFKLLSFASPVLMRKLSVEALTEVSYSGSDIIFSVGEETDKMGFVVSGVVRYKEMTCEELQTDLLGPQDWYCEAVLWTKWRCRGTMQADADCDILDISGASFRNCMRKHHLLSGLMQNYANAFVEVLNLAAADEFKYPLSDLQAPYLVDGEPIAKILHGPHFRAGK